MKNISDNWYKILTALCLFLFIVMVYRREARMRTTLDSMEARLAAMECYVQGQAARQAERELTTASANDTDTPRPSTPTDSGRRHTHRKDMGPRQEERRENRDMGQHTESHTETHEEEAPTGKFRQVTRLELNTVDSATLVRVPGIGAGTARAILQYRERLGGYYSAEQLREKLTWDGAKSHLDDWCENWFWTDEQLIQKIDINKLSFKELIHHPYLEFEEVKAIMRWRERHGAVHQLADLQQLGIGDSTKLERLLHYVEF